MKITAQVLRSGSTSTSVVTTSPGTTRIVSAQIARAGANVGVSYYVGTKARFVALDNGLELQVQDGAGDWITQAAWTE